MGRPERTGGGRGGVRVRKQKEEGEKGKARKGGSSNSLKVLVVLAPAPGLVAYTPGFPGVKGRPHVRCLAAGKQSSCKVHKGGSLTSG